MSSISEAIPRVRKHTGQGCFTLFAAGDNDATARPQILARARESIWRARPSRGAEFRAAGAPPEEVGTQLNQCRAPANDPYNGNRHYTGMPFRNRRSASIRVTALFLDTVHNDRDRRLGVDKTHAASPHCSNARLRPRMRRTRTPAARESAHHKSARQSIPTARPQNTVQVGKCIQQPDMANRGTSTAVVSNGILGPIARSKRWPRKMVVAARGAHHVHGQPRQTPP